MTEYEMAYLSNEYLNSGIMLATAQFSIASAYLVAGYLASHRLKFAMSLFVSAAFIWSSLTLSLTLYRLIIDYIGLRHAIFEAASSTGNLTWHSAAISDTANIIYAPVVPSIWFAVSLGAVYFFFYCRLSNLKAEAKPWRPAV